MINIEEVEKISKKYAVPSAEFVQAGIILNLKEKKRLLQLERLEMLARYGVSSAEDLSKKIENGTVPEHPAWEDLIEVKNINYEIKEIDFDLQRGKNDCGR